MSANVPTGTGSVRIIAASSTLTVAVIHAALTPSHLSEQFYLGVLFAIGSAALLVAFAGLLAGRTSPLSWWLAGLVHLGMFVGYLASRTVGLPSYFEQWNVMGIASVVVEFVFFAAFGVAASLRLAHGPLPFPPGADAHQTAKSYYREDERR